MGKLVIRDTGANSVIVNNSEYSYSGSLGASNPLNGYVNLKAFSFNYESASDVDDSSVLTRSMPRLTIGNSKLIPISFSSHYSRETDDRTTEEGLSPADIVNDVMYLDKWSRSKSILMLYWMPDDDSDIVSGQAKDYFSSMLRILSTNVWNNSWLSKNNNKYLGTFDYKAYSLPVVLNSITIQEDATTKLVTVNVSGFLVAPED